MTADTIRRDMLEAIYRLGANGVVLAQMECLVTPDLAVKLSRMTDHFGELEFPEMTPDGGHLLGFPVSVSYKVQPGVIVLARRKDPTCAN